MQHTIRLMFAILVATVILSGCSSMSGRGAKGGDGVTDAYAQGTQASQPANCKPGNAQASYHFAFDQYTIRSSANVSLQQQAHYIANHNRRMKVEGNTDNRGSQAYNLALGQRRADAIANSLHAYGAPMNRLSTVSYGAARPFAQGDTEGDYACNRRVDLVR